MTLVLCLLFLRILDLGLGLHDLVCSLVCLLMLVL